MGDLIVLSPPIPESLTTSKLADFSVFQKNTWKIYIDNILYKQIIVIYNVDIHVASKEYENNLGKLKQ